MKKVIKSGLEAYPPSDTYYLEAVFNNGDVYLSEADFATKEAADAAFAKEFAYNDYIFVGNETLASKLEEADELFRAGY